MLCTLGFLYCPNTFNSNQTGVKCIQLVMTYRLYFFYIINLYFKLYFFHSTLFEHFPRYNNSKDSNFASSSGGYRDFWKGYIFLFRLKNEVIPLLVPQLLLVRNHFVKHQT